MVQRSSGAGSRTRSARVNVAILGGGGFRVPLVYGALLTRAERLGVESVALYDVDETRLAQISPVLEGLERERGARLPVAPTTTLDDALDGADFVFCAIRVGQLEGRVVDERVPLDEGVVGQETTGPGGLCFALRTVPVMVELARRVALRAPQAWFVNFTNPAGIVTEAVRRELGDRALGICDSPAGLCRRVAAALGRRPEELWFDYFGLNHLGWLRSVHDGERDLLPELLADDERVESFEEGRLFGAEWLRALGMIPNEYLFFYYFGSDTVGALRSGLETRAEILVRQQAAFYGENGRSPHAALEAWRATRREREETYFAEAHTAAGVVAPDEQEDVGGYEREALQVVEAIARDERRVLILNTANRSSLPFLDADAVVEVPCVVDLDGRAAARRRRRPARRTGAARNGEGGRAADDRGLADEIARAGREGPRAAPARAVRERRSAHLRHLRGAPARARGALRMTATIDVVCTGPVFLDLTFEGLEELPEPGRERYARELHETPGGAAITAIGLVRLGLRSALAAPLGRDVAGADGAAAARGGGCDLRGRRRRAHARHGRAPARRRAGVRDARAAARRSRARSSRRSVRARSSSASTGFTSRPRRR